MDFLNRIWAMDLVRFVVFLLLAFVAAWVAQFAVVKLLKLIKLDKKLDKWGVNEGQVGTSMSFVGKLVYAIVFLLFLPAALNALGITGVSGPINNFVSAFIDYLPKIVASGILLYVGCFVAVLVGNIVSVLLKKTKLDSLIKRKDEDKNTVLISDVLVKILGAVIILVTVIQCLLILDIDAISQPAMQIVYTVFGAIPSIVLAAVVIAVGLLVASIASALLANVLVGVNFDNLVKKILPALKVSATKIVVNTVKALIVLFVAAQGIEALGLSVLTAVVAAVVAYLPAVIKSAAIVLVAYIGASLLEGALAKTSGKLALCAKYAKTAVYVLAGFMILSQLGIATEIVEKAFIIGFAAIALAFALAFGLGGRDFAAKTLEKKDEENK